MNKLIEKSLSGEEILKCIKGRANLVTYQDLKNYLDVYELMGEYKAVVILYEQNEGYGHWTCLFEQNPSTIEFFDPYGIVIDNEIKFTEKSKRKKLGMSKRVLSTLIANSNYKNIVYNEYQFQEFEKGINTCGRHVCARLIYRNLTLEQFQKLFKNTQNFNADIAVSALTHNI
jgi:hypothetical protein